MKIALVHDYIKEYGGAERVLEALHEIWPSAPVYTSVYLPEFLGPHKERFNSPAGEWNVKTSWLQYLPFKAKLISPIRLIAPQVFRQFDFSEFDVVIVSSTGAYIPNAIKCHPELVSGSNSSTGEMPKPFGLAQGGRVRHDIGKGPIHIAYCHTPPRYLYGFATARDWKKSIILHSIGEIANHFLRLIDFKSAQKVDFFVANSQNVAGRIKKFYKRSSTVIYPPVEISNSKLQIPNKSQSSKSKIEYYLAGGRIARPKHIELIVETFQKLNLPLVVFGREFAGTNNLKSTTQNSKIRYVGEISDSEKMELMKNAKAFVFASEDEDFGITPVEAMSVGTPVIAYKSGGVLETVLQGKTGVFFDKLTVESLSKVIKQFNNLTINPKDCIGHAQKFSKERFKKEMKDFVEKCLKT